MKALESDLNLENEDEGGFDETHALGKNIYSDGDDDTDEGSPDDAGEDSDDEEDE